MLILPVIFAVVANGRIDHNRSQPGFEGQRFVVTVYMLKRFQEPLIQNVFGFFNARCVAQTDTFCIPKKLFEQRSLRSRIVGAASLNDTQQVIIGERRRFSEEQSSVGLT